MKDRYCVNPKCYANYDSEVYTLTKKKKCVTCCIKGYKFALRKMHEEVEELTTQLLIAKGLK